MTVGELSRLARKLLTELKTKFTMTHLAIAEQPMFPLP